MIRVCDSRLKNNRENLDLGLFVNKSKPMTQNYMYLGCTPSMVFSINSCNNPFQKEQQLVVEYEKKQKLKQILALQMRTSKNML